MRNLINDEDLKSKIFKEKELPIKKKEDRRQKRNVKDQMSVTIFGLLYTQLP